MGPIFHRRQEMHGVCISCCWVIFLTKVISCNPRGGYSQWHSSPTELTKHRTKGKNEHNELFLSFKKRLNKDWKPPALLLSLTSCRTSTASAYIQVHTCLGSHEAGIWYKLRPYIHKYVKLFEACKLHFIKFGTDSHFITAVLGNFLLRN
jgi:hypothetical protein